MILAAHIEFDWSVLIPFVLLIGIGAVIPVILSALRLKIIPVFVVEITVGIIIAHIPFVREFFVEEHHGEFAFNGVSSALYLIGMAVLLFLSGLDTDFSVLKPTLKKDKKVLNSFALSWILMGTVIVLSVIASLFFIPRFEHPAIAVPLLAITFASTFASLVIPLVHSRNAHNLTVGKIICTYATIAEFLSIVALSVMLIVENGAGKLWFVLVLIAILGLTYVFKKYCNFKVLHDKMEGIVFLGIRLIVLVFLSCVIIADHTGVEFILGAFLAGMILKSTKLSHKSAEVFEAIGYGIFVPIFYMLVGVNVGVSIDFTNPSILLLIGLLFVLLVLTKAPFMILLKWYPVKTTLPTMFIASSTIIVSLTCEHFGVFDSDFSSALIIASALTCILPPILFDIDKKFGTSRPKYDEIIIDPHDIENQPKH